MTTLQELLAATTPGESRTAKAERSQVDEYGRYFVIRPNYNYPVGRFTWVNQPDLASYPTNATVNFKRTPLSRFAPFKLAAEGPPSGVLDYYDKGPVSFISDRLLAVIREFEPDAIDAVPAALSCGSEVLQFHAFMPLNAYTAADVSTTDVSIRTWLGMTGIVGLFFFPNKFRLNPEIPADVDIFADIAEPKMYWSRRLVETCKERGVRGISAQTTYAATVETLEF